MNRESIRSIYKPKQISVKITGNVKLPGIYKLSEGETLKHLIDKAGGLLDSSEKIPLDLDTILVDGQVIQLSVGKKYVR